MNKELGNHVIYYFFDHLLLRRTGEAKQVLEAVKNKDFDTFKKIFDKYPPYISSDGIEDVFFPHEASMFDKDDNFIGYVDVTTLEGFNLIDEVEYECG